ncbi:MAG: helix-turn-helix domain-containing protein [Actinomycetota bacterium]|nr:helix-turn-helix domain-containing protein [Actinomycetota bacterium]
MSTGKRYRSFLEQRVEAKRQREQYFVGGLKPCRVASGLSQKELADLIDKNQTLIADLENRDSADHPTFLRLCEVLKVAPEDLDSQNRIENPVLQEGQEGRGVSASEKDVAERRRQVNRLKDQAWRLSDVRSIWLGGLKARRLEAGLTQRELARMVGTNQTTIFELEKKDARRGAYMKTIRKLSEVLDVPPADLICGD